MSIVKTHSTTLNNIEHTNSIVASSKVAYRNIENTAGITTRREKSTIINAFASISVEQSDNMSVWVTMLNTSKVPTDNTAPHTEKNHFDFERITPFFQKIVNSLLLNVSESAITLEVYAKRNISHIIIIFPKNWVKTHGKPNNLIFSKQIPEI